MKVLGVLASPSPIGGSAQLLYGALKSVQAEEIKTELIPLYGGTIKPCIGCVNDGEPNCKFPCIFEDYGKEILLKIKEADGIIFATPVYWFNVSSPLKALLERMTCLEHMVVYGEQSYVEGKVIAAIAVGADCGVMSTISYILTTLNSMGAIIPPWAMAYSHKAKETLYDDKALMDAINVGTLVAKTIKMINKKVFMELKYENNHEKLKAIRAYVENLIKTAQNTNSSDYSFIYSFFNSNE